MRVDSFIQSMKPLDSVMTWSILSANSSANVDFVRWMHAARTFFDAELHQADEKNLGAEHGFCVGVAPARRVSEVTLVRVRTFDRSQCDAVMRAADAGVQAIGGAGMDVLVAKAVRVWMVGLEEGGDARAPLVLAAVLANVMLAPVVPPDEVCVFGVRGARIRLERAGWNARG
jgi:hypothetical protein